ncbi:MAG: PASTA domain-containing protein [Actinobacteria bacterium]|nr:MAG: PASTA domain-containing protein [Actinomycetota bacterium]
MAARFAAIVPRMAVIGLVWLFATGTLTYAAGSKLTTPAKVPAAVTTARPTLLVPDIRGQAFVFAKGILEDGGFGWRVTGSVQGYATNVVATQQPAPGTHVVDTGAPTLKLTMRHGMYPQDGMPENSSPYAGTSIVLPKRTSAGVHKPVARKAPTVRKKPAAKAAVKSATRAVAKPKRTAAKRKLTATRSRPPAFVVHGAPKEPLDEIPLTTRAKRLSAWLTPSRRPTAAHQRYWLFQHAWIVTGARFGWWDGASALRVLIAVDRRVESQWGIGRQSETVARGALAAVEAKAK